MSASKVAAVAVEETRTFKLSKPLRHDGKTWSEITLREPNVGDVIAAESFQKQSEQTVAIFASMSGVPIGAIRSMTLRDFRVIERWVAPFIAGLKSEEEDGAT